MYTDLIVFYLNALILAPFPTESDGAGFKPVFDTNPVNITAIQGETVFLNCTVNYLEDYKVAWLNPENKVLTNKDRRIIDDIRITIEHHSTTEWNLHFRNIQHVDEGVYTCAINTDPVQTKRVYLKVLVPSTIINKSSSVGITAVEGTTVQLVCNATGIPPPTVQWFRHIPKTTFDKATKEGKAVVEPGEVLLIHNVSRYCGGLYECVAYNNVDKAASRKIKVEVIFRPEIELPTRRISQVVNKETILQCIIRANPLLSSEWVKNGIRLENERKFRVEIYEYYSEIYTKVLDLHIRNVEKEDYGNYTCIAYNRLGEDKETMLLYEMVQPTFAPTTVKGTPSTAVHLPPYEVYDERTTKTKEQEILNTRPRPGNYGPRNSGFKLLFNIRYITLLFIVLFRDAFLRNNIDVAERTIIKAESSQFAQVFQSDISNVQNMIQKLEDHDRWPHEVPDKNRLTLTEVSHMHAPPEKAQDVMKAVCLLIWDLDDDYMDWADTQAALKNKQKILRRMKEMQNDESKLPNRKTMLKVKRLMKSISEVAVRKLNNSLVPFYLWVKNILERFDDIESRKTESKQTSIVPSLQLQH